MGPADLRPGLALTSVIPADDFHLLLMADVENLSCVFCDGHVGGAWRDLSGGFVTGVVFETPQVDAGRSLGGREQEVLEENQLGDRKC